MFTDYSIRVTPKSVTPSITANAVDNLVVPQGCINKSSGKFFYRKKLLIQLVIFSGTCRRTLRPATLPRFFLIEQPMIYSYLTPIYTT